tara:strand:+ start:23071 stop:25485 length:2415 start_codon:yes stop_codon:yes gene_type:complete
MNKALFFILSFAFIASSSYAQFSRSADYKNEEDAKIVVTDKEGNVVKPVNFDDYKKEGWDEKEPKEGKKGKASKEEKLAEKAQKEELKKREKEEKARYKKRPNFDDFEDEILYDINPNDFAKKKSTIAGTIPEEYTREYLPYIYNPKNKSVYNDLKLKVNKDDADEFRLYAYRNHIDVDSNNAGIRMPTFKDVDSKNDFRFDKAKQLMENGFFSTALPLLLEIQRVDGRNPDINQWIGICYLSGYNNQCRSIPYLRAAAANTDLKYKEYKAQKVAGNDIDAIFLLASAYQRCGKLEDADATFRTYIEAVKNNKKFAKDVEDAKMHLLQISQAERLLGMRGRQFETTNLSEINTLYSEIAARPVGNNTLLFASAKEPDQFPNKINFKEGRFFMDIYRTDRNASGWGKPEALPVNTPIDDIPLGINSENGKLFYHSYSADSSNVYIAEKNFETYKEGYAIFKAPPFLDYKNTYTITEDGKTLIFAAEDEGGFGGLDLYATTLKDDGSWKDPINLGETVNTPFDEITPFVHPNGRSLFFSRNGNESIGGFDVFKTDLSAFSKWEKAENVGMSVNTFGDDIFYSVTPDGHYGYVSRKGAEGDFDIFEINYFSTNPSLGGNNTKRTVATERGDLLLTNLVTGKAKWYAINRSNGKYNLILEPCVNYKMEWYKQSKVFKQETFMTPCNIENNSLVFDPNTDLGKIQVKLNETGKGNYNNPNEKLPNAWQVLVDGKPYRFENFSVQLRDEKGFVFHNTKLDKMGNFRLPDLNFQEPTFMVQVIDMDICERLSIKNLSGKYKELRYPECFTK